MNCVIVAILTGLISSAMTAKLITAQYMKLLNGYAEDNLKQTKELFRWFANLILEEKKNKR